jgi:hypothetical protein
MELKANMSITCPSVGIADSKPSMLKLKAVPNPTNGVTSIRYELPATSDVQISVVNMYGQTIFAQNEIGADAGSHSVSFDGSQLATGIYFINLVSDSEKVISKLVINR